MKRNIWTIILIVLGVTTFVLGVIGYRGLYKSYPAKSGEVSCKVETSSRSNWELNTRAITSTIGLFAFQIDSNAVDGAIDSDNQTNGNTKVYVTLVSTAAILAGVWTVFFIILIFITAFGQKIISYQLLLTARNKNLYVFFGISHKAVLLAKSILKNDNTAKCIFVGFPDADLQQSGNTWDKIVSTAHIQARYTYRQQLRDVNNNILIAHRPIPTIGEDDNHERVPSDIFGMIRLRKLKCYLRVCKKAHLLFLSDDEQANIQSAYALLYDTTLIEEASKKEVASQKDQESQKEKVTYKKEIHIYCHARRNSVNQVLKDVHAERRLQVHVVDSSHFSVELLQQDVANHPVCFVDLSAEKPGTVTSSFDALIIGFSEAGQDAFRFLYEFSAFVDAGSKPGNIFRSPFHCHIVDSQLPILAARWRHTASDVFSNKNADGTPMVHFHPVDYRSAEFYSNVLDPNLRALNYVVVCVGSDEEGIALAVDIVKNRIRNQLPFDHFRVFVRSYDARKKAYMDSVAALYNAEEPRIVIFGAEEDIYSYGVIINDKFTVEAKEYYQAYMKLYKERENAKVSTDEKTDLNDDEWQVRRDKTLNKGRSIQALAELRRKEGQDRANAVHAQTKQYIWNKAFPLPNKAQLREVLAQTEHLRWNASHELMGFRFDKKRKDDLLLVHNCLKPWQDLTHDDTDYDRMVVDVSIK